MNSTLFSEPTMAPPPTALELKMRVGKVRETKKLLKGAYIDIALAYNAALDTIRGGDHIRNVWNMRISDLGLTQAWEKAVGITPPGEPGDLVPA
jgi:hypothetical protein